MSMTVAIHQPDYIPWLGYFHKVYNSDSFIFLDNVQFSNSAGHNYRNIKTSQGLSRIKIPLAYSHGDLINQVTVKDELEWRKNHLKSFYMNYKKATHFDEIYHFIESIYATETNNLSELNQNFIVSICEKFGFETKFYKSSELNVPGEREERVINLCKKVGGTTYLSGKGAMVYQNPDNFESAGLKLIYSDFSPKKYHQLWGEFEPNVTVLDYIFNNGFDWSGYTNNI